jgi:hypothetical protein
MSARTSSPSVAQLCEHTRRLIAGARTPGVGVGLKREQVIRELRFSAQRHGRAGAASQEAYRQIATR